MKRKQTFGAAAEEVRHPLASNSIQYHWHSWEKLHSSHCGPWLNFQEALIE